MNTADAGFLSLVPAAVTIGAALALQRVELALAAGVLAGSVTVWLVTPADMDAVWRYFATSVMDVERLRIALFILLVGGLLEVIARSGAYGVLASSLGKSLSTPRRARLATFGLGLVLFFDDYANLLVTGATMRSMAVRHRISPALMAYIVDQMATFVSILLISTWAAFEGSVLVGAAEGVGQPGTATSLLMASLPFHAATWLGVLLAGFVAFRGRWLGARLDHRPSQLPLTTENSGSNASLRHVLIPMGLLVMLSLGGLAISALSSAWGTGPGTELVWMDLLGEAPTVEILVGATLCATVAAVLMILRDGLLGPSILWKGWLQGLRHMIPASLVIVLSKGLAEVSSDLGTGTWLAGLLGEGLPAGCLGALVFVVALLVTVATGFSWSSMAILMPVAFRMGLDDSGASALPLISGAVISGSILGGLMVPWSDTTVMTAAAMGISPVYHARTQLPQALLVAMGSVATLFLIGRGMPWQLAYLVTFGLMMLLHSLLDRPGGEL